MVAHGPMAWLARIDSRPDVAIAVIAACSSSKTPTKPDAPTADVFVSTCGHPGDTGNELGIGFFCETLSDCSAG